MTKPTAEKMAKWRNITVHVTHLACAWSGWFPTRLPPAHHPNNTHFLINQRTIFKNFTISTISLHTKHFYLTGGVLFWEGVVMQTSKESLKKNSVDHKHYLHNIASQLKTKLNETGSKKPWACSSPTYQPWPSTSWVRLCSVHTSSYKRMQRNIEHVSRCGSPFALSSFGFSELAEPMLWDFASRRQWKRRQSC